MPRVLIVKVDLIWFYATVASRRRVAKVVLLSAETKRLDRTFVSCLACTVSLVGSNVGVSHKV